MLSAADIESDPALSYRNTQAASATESIRIGGSPPELSCKAKIPNSGKNIRKSYTKDPA